MNILFTPSDSNGMYSGSTLSMVALVDLLQNRYGHNILVVLPQDGDVQESLDAIGVRSAVVRSYNWHTPIKGMHRPIRMFKGEVKDVITRVNVSKLARVIEENDIDLVHINTSATYIGALAALETGTPFVWHIREFLEEDHGTTIRHRERGLRLMAKADRLVAISQSIYCKYEPIFGAEKLTVIENGIDPVKYAYPEHKILIEDRVKFLMVGGAEGKGHRVAIKACLKLLKEGFDAFELVMLGRFQDEYRKSLETMWADVAGASDHFRFPGPTSDTPAYYRDADIFLMCSRAEAFGRVTVEAMMSGCLVIGANTAGTVDLIVDGATGYLFESGDSGALADQVVYALQHRDEARQVARDGQAYMLQNMTAEENAAKVNALYDEILRGGGTPK